MAFVSFQISMGTAATTYAASFPLGPGHYVVQVANSDVSYNITYQVTSTTYDFST